MMSWVKSISYSGEDVFDQDADDISLQNKEWKFNMEKRVKDGFVDGIDAGKEASLQAGFNLGYREGAAQTKAVGFLKGVISAIQCWCQIQQPSSPVPASVTELLQRVVRHEDALMKRMREAVEHPPPSVSDVSESMEDLGVNQGDPGCSGEGCKGENCCRSGGGMELGGSEPPVHPPLSCGECEEEESINKLLQCCIDILCELELPQGLIQQLQESMNTDFP